MAATAAAAAAATGEVVNGSSSSSSDELLNGGLDELYHGLVLPLLNELQRQYPLDTPLPGERQQPPGQALQNTNIEEEFSDFDVDNGIAEHNGVRAVIQLREEDYPDIFGQDYSDIFDTAGNFDGLVNTIPADSASPLLTREEPLVRTKTFVEEEQEATQDEVEDTADQLAILLSDLEGDQIAIHLLSYLAFRYPLPNYLYV